MKSLFRFILVVLFFGIIHFPAHADFSSLYIFGDGLSTTTNNPSSQSQSYYGKRRSNGRVWVEVLAQRQGVGISNNWSYFDCNSSNLVTNVSNFAAPSNAANALFVVWVNNSDLYDEALNVNSTAAEWITAINRAQTNHFRVITNLYFAKGARTLILPNTVDVSRIPYFNAYANTNLIRQECRVFNTNFAATLNQARAACPELKIYSPDFFTLLNNVLMNAPGYGLTNFTYNGLSIDAINDPALTNKSTNGPGANYIFWDPYDPSARLHAVMADVAQQLISPVQISQLNVLTGSNRLDLVNVPVGLNGFVDGMTVTNQGPPNWTVVRNFNSTNTTQSMFVIAPQFPPFLIDTNSGGGSIDPGNPGNGSTPLVQPMQEQLYRLRFPYAWNWP